MDEWQGPPFPLCLREDEREFLENVGWIHVVGRGL